jgi:tetratricopeptide (TPR) repeat protein
MNNSTYNNSELLVRYLDGELEGEEKLRLEEQIAADKSLQEELENLKLARDAVRLYGLAQKISGIHRQMTEEMKPTAPARPMDSARRMFRYSMAVAASVLLVYIGIEAYNYLTLTPEKIFTRNYQGYALPTLRDEAPASAIEKAYREKNYRQVIALYEQLSPENDIESVFLAGMARLELSETEKAIEQLQKVLSLNRAAGTAIKKDAAEYYLALAYLRNRNYQASLGLLQKIKNDPQHLYYNKITAKLLRQLNRLK